jgi:hypothetical protein
MSSTMPTRPLIVTSSELQRFSGSRMSLSRISTVPFKQIAASAFCLPPVHVPDRTLVVTGDSSLHAKVLAEVVAHALAE